MPQFAYKARRRSGEMVQGLLEVPDRAAALVQMERLGLFPIAVDAAKGGAVAKAERPQRSSTARTALLPPALRELLHRKRKPKLQELATFTQQLANLLHSGMPLTLALNSMTHLESKGVPPEVSKQLRQDVTEGKSLSDAMGRQPHVFSDLYINMVRAGEQSGALEDVLRRLASHYERFAEVQSKFLSALIYPTIVACVGVIIAIFFMTFMLPRFLEIFKGFQVPLPAATQLLVNISNFFSNWANWLWMLSVIVVGFIIFMRFKATDAGIRRIDGCKMNAPIIGKVVRLNLFAQFSRTLATLLINGVPVLTALKITEQVIPNRIMRDAIARTREEVTDGKTIAQPLARSKIFPQLMIDLLQIGEETGDVPGALQNVAETYENELTIALRVMTNLIEPALIIVMAVGVGFLLFSVLSAMFSITSSINMNR
ncbi:MAG: type II secretion system F family protein [Candidatus Omnitrophica bacterium]|nr:type II secretion system F family protein [Candidatus Omnitrophota bacterium]